MIRPADHPIHLVLGLIVWSVWFVAIYGGLSVACAVAPPADQSGALNWLNALMAGVTAALFAWMALQAVRCWRQALRHPADQPRSRFMCIVSAGAYAVAAVSTLVIGLPVMGLPPCL